MNKVDAMMFVVRDLNVLINEYGMDQVKHALQFIDTFPGKPSLKEYRFLNTMGRDYFLNEADFNRVNDLWKANQKIGAIKEFRMITSCGLKEAKDALEHYYDTSVHPY